MPNAVIRRRPWNGRFLILGGFLFVTAVVCIYASALAQQGGGHEDKGLPPKSTSDLVKSAATEAVPLSHTFTSGEEMLSGKTEFGQFPPLTEVGRELEKMLRGKNEDLDLALANWLIVADVPQFRDMTYATYFAQLNAVTEQVRRNMAMTQASGRHSAKDAQPQAIFINGGGWTSPGTYLGSPGEYLEVKDNRIFTDKNDDLTKQFLDGTTGGALIVLDGCWTGRDGKSIAAEMSRVLPGRTVAGGKMKQAPFFFGSSIAIGKKNYWINGDLVDSTW